MKLDGITILNDGNPMKLTDRGEGFIYTISPSTAKKGRGYITDKKVSLTPFENKMPGVVVCQNRGMIFSSNKPLNGLYEISDLKDMNVIIVKEKSRKLKPTDDKENKIVWKGNGPHEVKDVVADGAGMHYFEKNGKIARKLWLKIAKFFYGGKGMLMPGLESDIGKKVIDYWGIERTITLGNTIVINSSMIKGIDAYKSLEELVAHSEEWGLTTLMKQWQSGDHKPEEKRIIGTQAQATNLELTEDEITQLLRPEALSIWAMQFEEVAWMKHANINTSRGRAIAARPGLIDKDLVMKSIDDHAGNVFLRIAQGKVKAEGQYLKMFPDELATSLVYVDGKDINEAAKEAAKVGLHGEIRVNPSFAGRYYKKDENGVKQVYFRKETFLDEKGRRYIEVAIVRYPHGAPSETIVVRAYLDTTVPKDVIMFPLPAANDDGTIPVKYLYAFRLQGADFDGDADTGYTEKTWLEAQKRNIGKSYMIIPVNTESTEKDKTLVTDETFEQFCIQKVESLSNQVGLIATSLKYFMSQDADILRRGDESDADTRFIADHACAMGDDIDEFKHGKANNTLVPFIVERYDGEETLRSPYFNRYAMKYKSEEEFNKATYNKDGTEKKPGHGVLDMYAVATEKLMKKAGLKIVKEKAMASDGKDRFYWTVHPVKWQEKNVNLHITKGEGQIGTELPKALEELYGVEPGTKFFAKDLFLMLYRAKASLLNEMTFLEDEDQRIKNMDKLKRQYALAKIAVIAWTKAMKAKKAKEGETITAEEAMRIFATLMVQYNQNGRGVIDTLTRYGSFRRADGTVYQRTIFTAKRCFDYFLDICGDGLLFNGKEEPKFDHVSSRILEVADVKTPDMDKATELATKEIESLGEIADKLLEGMKLDEEEITSIIPDDINVDEDFLMNLQAESFCIGGEC